MRAFFFMGRCILIVACCLFLPFAGKGKFQYNNNCKEAHLALLKYDLEKGRELLIKESQRNPDNLIPAYLANYLDFFQLISYENPNVYDTLSNTIDKRLNRLKKGPEKSPFYYFTRGEVRLQWAILQVKAGDWLAGGRDFYKAYRLFKDTEEAYPEFLPVKKSFLPIQGMIGTLPDTYQTIISLFGIEGDLTNSMKAYQNFIDTASQSDKWSAYHEEGQLIQAFMQFHLMNDEEKAWQSIQKATKDYPTNPVSAFARANIAMETQQNKQALIALKPYKTRLPSIPHIDYLLGNAYLAQLNPECRKYFGRYTRHFKGNSYVKDTHLKLGWSHLIDGNQAFYQKQMYLVKQKGKAIRSVDKQAIQEINHYTKSNLYLLKARLYFDGGYLNKALKQFKHKSTSPKHQREHYYRLGRINQEKENYGKAMEAYQQLRGLEPNNLKQYYIPAAHYEIGVIYEDRNQKQKAIDIFQQVLNYEGYPYEKSFKQKAKAGIKRLKEN